MTKPDRCISGFLPAGGKSLSATFDACRLSSDGGLIVLREIATRLRLAETVTGPLRDERDPARIRHSYAEMATARILMIAAGYEDCDDVDALRADPALKIAIGCWPGDRRRPDEPADAVATKEHRRLAGTRSHWPWPD